MDILTTRELAKFKTALLKLVPTDGTSIGNIEARRQLTEQIKKQFDMTIAEDDYWKIRKGLIEEGKIIPGGGRGGSILRSSLPQQKDPVARNEYHYESSLYEHLEKSIPKWLETLYGIEQYVSVNTAKQGKRDTGGPWTRPDIVVFAVRTYPYIPSKLIELLTFEIKPINNFNIEGVFETASHSAVAHRSYLMIHVSKDDDSNEEKTSEALRRLGSEAQRMGIGLITFDDPKNHLIFNLRVEAALKEPDPAKLCAFITAQFPAKEKEEILKKIK